MEGLKLTSWPDLQLNMSKACRNLSSRRLLWLVEHSFEMIYTSRVRLALKGTAMRLGKWVPKTVLTRRFRIQ